MMRKEYTFKCSGCGDIVRHTLSTDSSFAPTLLSEAQITGGVLDETVLDESVAETVNKDLPCFCGGEWEMVKDANRPLA